MTTQTEQELKQAHANDASVRIALATVGSIVMGFWSVAFLGLAYVLFKLIIGMPWYYVPHPSESESSGQAEFSWGWEQRQSTDLPPYIPSKERYEDDPVTEDPEIH